MTEHPFLSPKIPLPDLPPHRNRFALSSGAQQWERRHHCQSGIKAVRSAAVRGLLWESRFEVTVASSTNRPEPAWHLDPLSILNLDVTHIRRFAGIATKRKKAEKHALVSGSSEV